MVTVVVVKVWYTVVVYTYIHDVAAIVRRTGGRRDDDDEDAENGKK